MNQGTKTIASALKSCIRIYKRNLKKKFFDLEKVKKPVFLGLKMPLEVHRGREQTTVGYTVEQDSLTISNVLI